MPGKTPMQRLFAYLICANGVLTVLLSLVILADIWIADFLGDGITTGKIIISYMILLVNFAIFVTMYNKLGESGNGKALITKDDI